MALVVQDDQCKITTDPQNADLTWIRVQMPGGSKPLFFHSLDCMNTWLDIQLKKKP